MTRDVKRPQSYVDREAIYVLNVLDVLNVFCLMVEENFKEGTIIQGYFQYSMEGSRAVTETQA